MSSLGYHSIVCEKLGSIDDLKLIHRHREKLNKDQIRIKVEACGINFPDKLMVEGKYQLKPTLPFTPGMELSGTVIESNTKDFRNGTNVIAQMRYGGFTEEVIVNKENVIIMPKVFNFEEAAGFSVAAQTAYVSLVERANIQAGNTLLILGATGGVGLAAIQLGVILGAKVIAICGNKKKQITAIQAGAKYAFHYDEMINRVKEVTKNEGVDIIYDPIGGEHFSQSLKVIKWGGKVLIIGFASGNIPSISTNYALIKGISLLGVRAGEYFRRYPNKKATALKKLFDMANTGNITPLIYKTLPLSECINALKKIENREVIGRIILKP